MTTRTHEHANLCAMLRRSGGRAVVEAATAIDSLHLRLAAAQSEIATLRELLEGTASRARRLANDVESHLSAVDEVLAAPPSPCLSCRLHWSTTPAECTVPRDQCPHVRVLVDLGLLSIDDDTNNAEQIGITTEDHS